MALQDPGDDPYGIVKLLADLTRLPRELLLFLVRLFYRHWSGRGTLDIEVGRRRRTGFRALVLVLAGLGGLAWWKDVYLPEVPRRELVRLLTDHCWVTYDPSALNPLLGATCSSQSIRIDMRRIRAAGFTGVVTFGSRGSLARIPRIARAERLAVIMGIWSPGDVDELRNAIAQRDVVDAYCVGHDGLNQRGGYDLEELGKAIALVKRRTGRPVTTSDEVQLYYENPALRRLGDWLFPDIHVSLLNAANSPSTPGAIVDRAKKIAAISAGADRPLMLKMVTFPWQGLAGASLRGQGENFDRFLEGLRSPEQGLAVRPAIVIHSAFDLPWKQTFPFYEWDPFTGVLNADGTARPAARVIVAKCP